MAETNINLLDSAVALGIKGVTKPKYLEAPHVPKDALDKAKKRFEKYQSVLKKNKHASIGNKIKMKWQKGNFDTDAGGANPKEVARRKELKLAILDTKVYLTDAATYFEGCTGNEILKKYSEQVDKDLEDLVSKGYLVRAEATAVENNANNYENDRAKGQQDRSARNVSRRFPKEKYNVIGDDKNLIPAARQIQIADEDNYLTRVKNVYKIAHDWFHDILETKFDNVNDAPTNDQYVLKYVADNHLKNSPINNTTSKTFLMNINTIINNFAEQENKLAQAKKEFNKQSKKPLFRNKFNYIETLCMEIKDRLYDIQSSAKLYYVGLSTSSKQSKDVRDILYGIYDDATGIPRLMSVYLKNVSHTNTRSSNIRESFTELFKAINHLEKTVNSLKNPAKRGKKKPSLIARLTNLRQDTGTNLKNIDKTTEKITKALAQTEKFEKAVDNLQERLQQYKEHKESVRHAWEMFAIGTALGAVQSTLSPIATLLTAAKKAIPVAPLA